MGRAWLQPGLRVRIAAAIAAIVLVAVGTLGVAVHLLLVANQVAAARAGADGRMHAAMEVYRSTGLLSFDARTSAPDIPGKLRAAVPRDGDRATLVTGGTVRTVWAVGRTKGTLLSTRTRFRAVNSMVRVVDRALLGAGAATVLAAVLVGWLSANRLARRLRLAARTARSLAAGGDSTSLRAAVGGRHDEVGDLADAVDTLAGRLAGRLAAERRFTADVAHDLRTPVTGLIAAAALLDDTRPAQLVRNRTEALGALVEELLEVARLDRGIETAELEHVDLLHELNRTIRRGVESGEYPLDAVLVRGESAAETVITDPRRLARVISNLVRNGLRHGAAPVEVVADGSRVTIRDHGPGFDPQFLAEGPQRFRRADPRRRDGNGLGLVIAAGQAAVLGASLELGNHPDGGACVVLTLPGPESARPDAAARG